MKRCIIQSIIVILCVLLTGLVAIAQEGKIDRITVHSPSLEGNLFKDSPDRGVIIYLPPSYDNDPGMRYPVVYLLHGYTGNDMLWTGGSYISNGNIKDWMKIWINDGKVKEMILVMPNSYNVFRGSMYINSIATGKWADYIAKDLVEYIDSHYRTLPQRESRAIIGHAMGGYGGMTLGMDYPDVFGCMGSLAGLLDMNSYPTRINWAFAQGARLKNLSDFYSQSVFDVELSIAMSAALSPNPDKPPFYADFPWEYDESNNLKQNQAVWDRFLARDVLKRIPSNIETLKRMRAIYIDCDTLDQRFNFIIDARLVRDELQRLDIPHQYEEFSGNHTCCVMNSTGNALEVFSKAMSFEMLTGVEPKGKLTTTWGQIRQKGAPIAHENDPEKMLLVR